MIKEINFEFNALERILEADISLGGISYKYNIGDVVITGNDGNTLLREPLVVASDSPLPVNRDEKTENLFKLLVVNMLQSKYKFHINEKSDFINISEKNNEKYLDIIGRLNKLVVPNTIVRNYLDSVYYEIIRINPNIASETAAFPVFEYNTQVEKIMLSLPNNSECSLELLDKLIVEENLITDKKLYFAEPFDLSLVVSDICKVFERPLPEKYSSYKFSDKPIIEILKHLKEKLMNVSYFKRNVTAGLHKDIFRPITIGTLLFELKDDGLHVVTETDNLYSDKYYKAPINLVIDEKDFIVSEVSIPTLAMGLPDMMYEAKYHTDSYRIVFEAGAISLLDELCTEEFSKALGRLKLVQRFKDLLRTPDGRDMITDGFLSATLKMGWSHDTNIKQETVTFLPIENTEDLRLSIRYIQTNFEETKQVPHNTTIIIEKGMVFEESSDGIKFKSLEYVNLSSEYFFDRVEGLSDVYKEIFSTK